MGRLSKEELARFSGANWLLEFAKTNGIEEAEKELDRRGVRNMPLKLRNSDVDIFVKTERQNIMNCILINTIATLQDEFDFDESKCKQFTDRWNEKMACLAEGYTNWKDVRQSIHDELGIWIDLSAELENEE